MTEQQRFQDALLHLLDIQIEKLTDIAKEIREIRKVLSAGEADHDAIKASVERD